MFYNDRLKWDLAYDVIVVGFGGAGASSARFAADHGAQVLLIDSAPEGSEGGNTRYAGGAFAWGNNFNNLKDYYKQTYYPFKYDPKVLDEFIERVMDMKEYSKKYFDIEAMGTGRRPNGEYPEYRNANSMQSQSMTTGMYNGGFWKLLRKQVMDRLDKIDVWYESPAEHLIQDPDSKQVLGVQIKRKGLKVNVAATHGVVLSLGGFENNEDMVQNFLGQGSLAPIGTLYNQGKGIDLAVEVGARLWHMSNYDSHGFSLRNGDAREKFAYMINWKSLFNGSIFVAGDDGTRYYREDEEDRHGYKYNHGNWIMLPNQNHPHIVMDKVQFEQLQNDDSANGDQIRELISYAIKADNLDELAEKISAPKLSEAVDDYNFLVDQGRDMFLNRKIETMRKFGVGPYYAIPIRHNILHTHGGARRNEKCEVIDMAGFPIPNLYEAGELGDIFATKYIGGSSIADLLISGEISGTNAAKNIARFKFEPRYNQFTKPNDWKSDAGTSIADFEAGPRQGIGTSENGISDTPIVVRVTASEDDKLAKIEVLQQKESPSIGGKAIQLLTNKMLVSGETSVDAVSGATTTSRAFMDAVTSAFEQAKKN